MGPDGMGGGNTAMRIEYDKIKKATGEEFSGNNDHNKVDSEEVKAEKKHYNKILIGIIVAFAALCVGVALMTWFEYH
ncbi:MAG: hypothetical protein Q4E53_14680 [Eubacteriales bacterium]|nr:hypothetical protein [Eubacteriales bacterium]